MPKGGNLETALAFESSTSKGIYRVINLAKAFVWFHFEGFVVAELWKPTEELLERVIAENGRVVMLGNGIKWKGYDSAYRSGCTKWFLKRRQTIDVHLLVSSPILKMGINVVNLAVPVIHGYDNPVAFVAVATQIFPGLKASLSVHGLPAPVLEDQNEH